MFRSCLSTSVKENTFKNLLNTRSHLIEITQRMTYHFDYQALQVCSHAAAAAATFCLDKWSFKNSVVTIWVLFALCQPLQCFSALQEFTWSIYEHHVLEASRKYHSKRLSLQELQIMRKLVRCSVRKMNFDQCVRGICPTGLILHLDFQWQWSYFCSKSPI